MKHIVTLNQANLKKSAAKGGCGECQASRKMQPQSGAERIIQE